MLFLAWFIVLLMVGMFITAVCVMVKYKVIWPEIVYAIAFLLLAVTMAWFLICGFNPA